MKCERISRWKNLVKLVMAAMLPMVMAIMTPGVPGRSLLARDVERPNVVLIISDDQGYTDYGFMGHPVIETPRLDKLASESLVYTRGFVVSALCSPSLATLLTGLYPHQHQMTGNDPSDSRNQEVRREFVRAFSAHPQLPRVLGRAGYVSFQTGKFWMENYENVGFTGGMTTKGRHGEDGLVIGRKTMKPIYDFIDKAQEDKKPFFIWYAPFMPHTPHTPPQRLRDKYQEHGTRRGQKGVYFAMCEWLDDTCGQLLDFLDQRGLRENTMVVYICDNGWPRAAKGSPYHLGTRTPIMIRWPGKVKPRMETEKLASSIDIVPTILAACGLPATTEMSGLDLLDGEAVAARSHIFGENLTHDMADVNNPAASLRCRTCIEGDWELIVWQDKMPELKTSNTVRKSEQKFELYNLKDDPEETTNEASQHPDVVQAMRKKIDAWWNPNTK